MTENLAVVHGEIMMNATTLYLRIVNHKSCDKYKLRLVHGSLDNKETCIYQVNYSQASGGQSVSRSGKIIKDQSPQARNFLIFSKAGNEILKISYNEIIKLDFEEVNGEKIYQLKLK